MKARFFNLLVLGVFLSTLHLPACTALRPTAEGKEYIFARDGFRGPVPGAPRAVLSGGRLRVENDVLSHVWSLDRGRLKPLSVTDRISGAAIALEETEAFTILFADGKRVACSALRAIGAPRVVDLAPREDSARYSETLGGKEIRLTFADGDGILHVDWRAILREGSNYLRQEVTLRVPRQDRAPSEVVLVDLPLPGVRVRGRVDGSPLFGGTFFLAIEHPMAKSSDRAGRARGWLEAPALLGAQKAVTVSSVIGVVVPGQSRRAFQFYLERERAHPYRQFLHYNSWYDIAWPGHLMNEPLCAAVIEEFGRELIAKRGVPIASFVFDDGWDDHDSLWEFHEGFPEGFGPLAEAAARHGSRVGTWISPWGGYGGAKQARLNHGRSQNFEINGGGFSLAGPRYNRRFTEICRRFMKEYGCNYFKFDGIGGGTYARGAPAAATADLGALLALCGTLRGADPDLFINATVGTWPSPWWLFGVDSVWRQGEDINFTGEAGTMRDRWITYRDSLVHSRIVKGGPLFPLNALMFHGLALAQLGTPTRMNNDVEAFRRDVRNFFATGTALQELYVTAALLTPAHWDILAEAARWAGEKESILVDSHWVGGDPARGEVYGFASWSPQEAVIMLRNPLDEAQTFTLDAGKVFEFPGGAPSKWILRSPWIDDAAPAVTVQAGTSSAVRLKPLQVAVWNAEPVAGSQPYAYAGYEKEARTWCAPREKFVGRWEYFYRGVRYEREFRADGSAMLYIAGNPYSGWEGFTWHWDEGRIFVERADSVIDGEHELEDDDTLLFVTDPFGPARRSSTEVDPMKELFPE